ncbi:MAG: mechanosensitive ion channel family protein [Limisphaerales bacterium]
MPILTTRSVRNIVRYLTLVIAACFILEQFGFHMNTVLAVLGTILGLIAIGFVATWSILSNFLCTFVLILFKPFAIGDEVEIPGDSVAGKVVDITLLFTTLRTPTGEFIHVPNNMFFQKIFKRRLGANAIALSHQLRQEKPAE